MPFQLARHVSPRTRVAGRPMLSRHRCRSNQCTQTGTLAATLAEGNSHRKEDSRILRCNESEGKLTISLVTGAAGFIGSRLIVELLREGHQVIAALRNAATKKEKLLGFIATQGLTDPSISFVEYDLSHDFKLDSLLTDAQKKIHVVYHLAASFNWGISKAEAQRTNVKSGLALIEWAATLKQLERFIWIGGYRVATPPQESADDLYYKYGGYEASKILGHQAFIETCKRLNVPWTAINPATVIDGFYTYGDMQYIGIAEMIGKLYQGRLMALPGGRDTFLPLCNMQYIVSFLIRTMFYPETIAQEYMLLDPATPKFHRLVHLAAEHLGVSSPHLQIPKVLLEKLPEVLLDGSKEQLSFISTEHYHVAGAEAMAAKMGMARAAWAWFQAITSARVFTGASLW